MGYVPPSAPLSIGGVLDDWLRLFRESFSRCWPLTLVAVAAGVLLEYLMTPSVPPAGTPQLQYYLQMWSAVSAPQGFLAQLLFYLVMGVVYGALLAQQWAMIRGEAPLATASALTLGLNRLPQMILGMILLALIMSAIVLPAGVIGAIVFGLYHERAAIGLTPLMVLFAVAVLLGFCAIIYVAARLQLWPAAIFADDCGGAAALGRSWALVRGHWWRVTLIGFVGGVLMWILELAVGIVTMLAAGLFSPPLGDIAGFIHRIRVAAAVAQTARIVTMPLLTAIWLAIYHDLKLRREGGDLAARAEALGTS